MKKTQEQFVIKELLNNRKISRNYCLNNFISRLGAIICSLNKEGWKIEGEFVKNPHGGKDFVYYVVDAPFTKVEYRVDGQVVSTSYEKVK